MIDAYSVGIYTMSEITYQNATCNNTRSQDTGPYRSGGCCSPIYVCVLPDAVADQQEWEYRTPIVAPFARTLYMEIYRDDHRTATRSRQAAHQSEESQLGAV
jgi:hypothetical protein